MKQTLLLLIFLKIAFAAFSQKGTDTLCFPISEVQKNVSYRISLEEEVNLFKDDVRILNATITNLEKQLSVAVRDSTLSANNIRMLNEQIVLHKANRVDLELKITGLEKELKKQRRKTFWARLTGAVATAFALFLYASK